MTSVEIGPVRHIGRLVARAAALRGDREYAVFEDRRLTFGELSRWVDQVGADFVRRGIGPGDRVLVSMPNCLALVVLQLAAWRIGAVPVPVVTVYREHEIEHIVRDAQPKAVAVRHTIDGRALGEEVERSLAAAGVEVAVKYATDGPLPGWAPLPDLDETSAGPLSYADVGPQDPCLILYTSGTTSEPKGARLTTRALMSATAAWERLHLSESDVGLVVAPLAHIAGMVPGCLVPLRLGCRVAILPRWRVGPAVELIDREKVTYSTGATVFLHDLVNAYEQGGQDIHRISRFVLGGSAASPNLVARAQALGIWASRAYGMTETGGVIAMADRDAPLSRRAQYDGLLLDDVDVRILDGAGNELPAGSEGNLWIRGPQLLLDYTDAEATRRQLRGGWFDPGDVGSLTADRWLRITGRTKDIINRGGEKFSARDIEEVLTLHPSVDSAACVAVPHPRLGEGVCAFLTLRPGAPWAGPEAVAAFLTEQRLAKAKIPIEWHVLQSLPTTATGKVQKHVLLAMRKELADG